MHTRNLTWSVLGFLYLFQRALSDSFWCEHCQVYLGLQEHRAEGYLVCFPEKTFHQMGILFSYNQLNYIRPHPECIQHWNNWTHTHTHNHPGSYLRLPAASLLSWVTSETPGIALNSTHMSREACTLTKKNQESHLHILYTGIVGDFVQVWSKLDKSRGT